MNRIGRLIENIGLAGACTATFIFVFSAVLPDVNACWWVLLVLCLLRWGCGLFIKWQDNAAPDSMLKRDHRMFAVLLCGVAIRFVLALAMEPRVVSDNAIFWNGIQRWSAGDFVETKSYALTALYAAFQAVFGIDFQLNQFINAGLGVAQIFLSYDLAFRIFRNRSIACASGLLVAFHPVLCSWCSESPPSRFSAFWCCWRSGRCRCFCVKRIERGGR